MSSSSSNDRSTSSSPTQPLNLSSFNASSSYFLSNTSNFESRIPSYSKRNSIPSILLSNTSSITPVLHPSSISTSLDPVEKLASLHLHEAIPHIDSVLSTSESLFQDSLEKNPTLYANEKKEENGTKNVKNSACIGTGDSNLMSIGDEKDDESLIHATDFASSGRIQVFVRVRPSLPQDPLQREEVIRVEDRISIQLQDPSAASSSSPFCFDHVFYGSQCDDPIFRKVGKPLVRACLEGFNGTLIAYGQTGSGKTHTLFSDNGLLLLTLQALYERLISNPAPFSVAFSMIQIYQEKIYDLLANDSEVELREHPELGVYLERGTKLNAMTFEECKTLILEGYKHRIVKETMMNQTSSRSHVIVFLEISQTFGHVLKKSKLTFCDLAGSERVKKTLASGTILNEAKEINLSLLEMGNVIQSLANRKKHIPFRNAVLTRILQESLGGNCLTYLIICVSPCKRDLSETKSSLLFGSRAIRIKTYAKVNEQVDHTQLALELSAKLANLESEYVNRELEYQQKISSLESSQNELLHQLNLLFSQFFPNTPLDDMHYNDWFQMLEEWNLSTQQTSQEHMSQSKVYSQLVKRLLKCTALSLDERTATPAKLLAIVEYLEDKLEAEKKENIKPKAKLRCLIQ